MGFRWGIFILDPLLQGIPQQALPVHLPQNSMMEWRWYVRRSAFLLPAAGCNGKKGAKIELDELRQVLSNRLARLVGTEQASVSTQRSQKLGLSTTSEVAAAEEEWELGKRANKEAPKENSHSLS